MTDYRLEQVLNENTVVLSSKYGSQIWSKCKLRKDNTCEQTGIILIKGSGAFRPNTNGYNRMHRISINAMNIIINE
jgi:hypothetical protein